MYLRSMKDVYEKYKDVSKKYQGKYFPKDKKKWVLYEYVSGSIIHLYFSILKYVGFIAG